MKPSATTITTASPPNLPLWTVLTEVGGDQWAAAAGCASAMFKGLEAMRKAQEHAAREAADRHAAAAERLKNGCSATDIAAIQASLLKSDIESVTHYLQRIAATTMEMQTRMFTAWNRTVDAEAMMESLSALSGKPH